MWKDDKDLFPKIAESYPTTFDAINSVAKQARKLGEETNTGILESKLISWVITGKKPEAIKRVAHNSKDTYLHDMLSMIDNKEIYQSVKNTYSTSTQLGHLIYCYSEALNEDDRARVRVISRMIWCNANK